MLIQKIKSVQSTNTSSLVKVNTSSQKVSNSERNQVYVLCLSFAVLLFILDFKATRLDQ